MMKKCSAAALATSAVVVAIYMGVIIGIATWSDNHQETGVIVDESDSNAAEGLAAGSQENRGGAVRASLSPKLPGDSLANDEERKIVAMITLRTTKRKKLVSTQGDDDVDDNNVSRATAAADDTTGFESIEGPRKHGKAKPKRTLSTRWKTSPTDDLVIELSGTERYEKKRYVPRWKRVSTTAGTMGDFNLETSSSDETASMLKRRPSTHEGAVDDVATHDESTVSETADLSPETASGKARASDSRRRKTAATTSEHARSGIAGGETTPSSEAKDGGPAELTGHETDASDILVDNMITGSETEKIVSNVETTITPSGDTKSEAKEEDTKMTAKALSIGSGQRKWTPTVADLTVQGHKILGASKREHSTLAVTGRTVQGRKILTATKRQGSTRVVADRTMQGRKILGARKRQNSTSVGVGPTIKGHTILGARKNNTGEGATARTVKALRINRKRNTRTAASVAFKAL